MTNSIAVRPGSQLWLRGTVTLDYIVDPKLKGVGIAVYAYSLDDGGVLYGELKFPSDPGWPSFILGGGSSRWLVDPQPAHCTATLYQYVWKGKREIITVLAACEFDATESAP